MKHYIDFIAEQLKTLTAIPSPSGYTKNATDYLMKLLQDMGYEPKLSRKGNVFVTLGGDGEPLVLAAHVDTLGAMVRSIKDNGRLRPTTLGGHVWSTADGENCTIHTRDGKVYTGVVLNTEPSAHVADKKVETLEENMEILLDEPVSTKAETLALGIQTGDIIAMDPRTVITESGYIKSRFLDDKLSASILLGIAKIVKDESLSFHRKVSLLFTVYEEVGHGGSFVPEDTTEMISVDMGCVGADLGCTERMVSICAKDSGGPYNYDLVTELSNIAKEEQLIEELEADAEEHPFEDGTDEEEPDRKKLKRELWAEALARLEDSARTQREFENVIAWRDRRLPALP